MTNKKQQPKQKATQEKAEDIAARLQKETTLPNLDAEKLKTELDFDGDADELKAELVENLQPEILAAQAQNPQDVDAFMPQIPDVIESPEDAKEAAAAIGQMDVDDLKAELKRQIMEELKDDQVKKMELEKERRERETEEQQKYIAKMKESPDPWVDVIGWVKDSNGVRTELEWNDAFVDYLRAEGVTGVDDDAVVQKWVVVLMHDMANRMDEEGKDEEPSEFGG